MTATLTPTREWSTRAPSLLDSPAPAARVYDAVKVYGRGENEVRALDGVTVEFDIGRFTAIMGPSGSGKSTLMHSVAGLDTLTSGTVLIGDADISKLDDRRLTQLRRDASGSSCGSAGVLHPFLQPPPTGNESRLSSEACRAAGRWARP